jgi:hypothetical protein
MESQFYDTAYTPTRVLHSVKRHKPVSIREHIHNKTPVTNITNNKILC